MEDPFDDQTLLSGDLQDSDARPFDVVIGVFVLVSLLGILYILVSVLRAFLSAFAPSWLVLPLAIVGAVAIVVVGIATLNRVRGRLYRYR